MNIVLLGPPGAGKGTQAEPVAARLGLRKLATGDVLRAALRDGTDQGMRAKSFMERGDLVPDAVILGILKEAMAEPASAKGVVLDGAVRTVPQAEGLAAVMADLGRRVDAVLMFDVPDDELVQRLSSRTVCDVCQTPYSGRAPGTPCDRKDGGKLVRRADDEPEAIRRRLQVYRDQTAPVLDWYGKNGARVVTVDAVGPKDEITERVLRGLAA
ncbi:MAG: adenylate kinase [Gemmatimonadota bacterium]|nr:adenylate kinase [Gemmatimonadota bacterium]